MDERLYELDSHGDITFLLYDVPKSLPETLDKLHPWMLDGSEQHLTPEGKEEETNQKLQSVLKIRASSKHLTLSSPQFTHTLRDGFQESNDLQKTGHLELKIENWDPAAFLVLMLILHARTRLVPREMTISKLADFAVLIDYYECYEACGYLQGNLTGRFCSELPIPRRVCDAIDRAREDAIGMMLDRLHDRVAVLRWGDMQCSYECDFVLLGELTRHVHRLGILEKSAPPFEGIAVEQLAKEAQSVVVPRWYEHGSDVQHSCPATLDFNSSLRCPVDALRVVDLEDVTKLRR